MATTPAMAPARPVGRVTAGVVRVTGAGLLATNSGIHLHLYRIGYRGIPTIGPMFLLNVVTGMVLAAVVLLSPQRMLALSAFVGGGFQIASLGALLMSLTVGLFGFTETTTAPWVGTTIAVESVGAVLLLAYAAVDGLPRARAWLHRYRHR